MWWERTVNDVRRENVLLAYDPKVRSPPLNRPSRCGLIRLNIYLLNSPCSVSVTHVVCAVVAMALKTNYKHSQKFNRPSLSERGTTGYDESGQVFTETKCYGGPMTADWFWKTKGSSRNARRFRSRGPGCSSLVDVAIRSVLDNSYSITPESLEGVPWELASVLWQRIVASYDI